MRWGFRPALSIEIDKFNFPPFLRCGVSVAPVVDWTLYDTYYTERYMGLLDENKRGYNDSMVLWRLDALRYITRLFL